MASKQSVANSRYLRADDDFKVTMVLLTRLSSKVRNHKILGRFGRLLHFASMGQEAPDSKIGPVWKGYPVAKWLRSNKEMPRTFAGTFIWGVS